jgi:putative ABC transport system permease protein
MRWLTETVRIALMSLRANKLRTVLTVIGVIIGIGTIIGMLSLINGINESVMEEFRRLGPDVMYITREEPGLQVGPSRRDTKEILLSEVEELGRRCESVDEISLIADRRANVGYRGRRSGMMTIRGVLTEYGEIGKIVIEQGRFFNPAEGRRSRVCVLGSGVVKTLFGKVSPLDKQVDIEGRSFRVIGTLEETGTVFGESSDDMVMVSYTWCRRLFGESRDDYVMALPAAGTGVDDAVDDIRITLRGIRRLTPGQEDDFAVSTQESLLDTYKQLTGTIYWVMRIVASIALLVSGVGIMNIMFVVVMERTREIGLRKAVGAPRVAIAGQFLVEAVVLTLLGGMIGIALGFLISIAVSALTPLPASVPLWAVPVSLGICCAVGIFFGFYPAMRASGLDPVRALHYE